MDDQGRKWPNGTCAFYATNVQKPDTEGRVWMHCEQGMTMTKASMTYFVMHCLNNRIEIGQMHPFNPDFERSQFLPSVRIHPEQIEEFECATGFKLRKPPRMSLNSSSPSDLPKEE